MVNNSSFAELARDCLAKMSSVASISNMKAANMKAAGYIPALPDASAVFHRSRSGPLFLFLH